MRPKWFFRTLVKIVFVRNIFCPRCFMCIPVKDEKVLTPRPGYFMPAQFGKLLQILSVIIHYPHLVWLAGSRRFKNNSIPIGGKLWVTIKLTFYSIQIKPRFAD